MVCLRHSHFIVMYGTNDLIGGKKNKSTGYLVRPKMGWLRNFYSGKPLSSFVPEKRKKSKKSALPKMEFRRKPDYADTAYREAVSRLRILLAETYTPIRRPLRELDSAGEETDNQSLISGGSRTSRFAKSYYHYPTYVPKRFHYYPHFTPSQRKTDPDRNLTRSAPKFQSGGAPPELMAFIERQEDYIEQLEKESRFCRNELSSLLGKVKGVISENENLHEKQKNNLIKSVFDHLETETETETDLDQKRLLRSPKSRKSRPLEGPAIVFESRISELEAQLTQAKIDLKKAQEENETHKRKIADGTIANGLGFDSFKNQVEHLQREKDMQQETILKLQSALAKLRDKEHDTCDQVKKSLDVAEQAQFEKNSADIEIRRLKDELERQHSKLREAIADQSRRIADERNAVERRYTQQIEQLTAELGVQWETTNKLQLELDKQRRENADLRRECAQKQALIDELRKDMQNKIITLQSDIGVTGAEKSALEQQIATLQMANERNERQYKQEIARLQAEMQSLRARSDRSDADLIHSRRENIRLNERIASLEKEINLNAALSEERSKRNAGGDIMALPPPSSKKEDKEKELGSMIQDMESKHAATVAELEGMIHSQNQLMDKLSAECYSLTRKLEEATNRHKEEIRELQTNLDNLNNRLGLSQISASQNKQDEIRDTISPQDTTQPSRRLSRHDSNLSSKVAPLSRRTSSDNSQRINSVDKTAALRSQLSQERLVNIPSSYQDSRSPNQQYSVPQYVGSDRKYVKAPNAQYTAQPGQYDPQPGKQYDPQSDGQYDPQHKEQYDTQPDSQYEPQPNQQYDPHYGDYEDQYLDQEYPTDSNQQYTMDPNQQYSYDPNQQYMDPSQQYLDPNQQYSQLYAENQQFDQSDAKSSEGAESQEIKDREQSDEKIKADE